VFNFGKRSERPFIICITKSIRQVYKKPDQK